MKFPSIARLDLLLLCSTLPAAALSAQQPTNGEEPNREYVQQQTDPAPAQLKDQTKLLPWVSSLGEGYRRALADRKPVLIRVGVSWCPACRKLAEEIEKPAVQAELSRWTRAYIDADSLPGDAEALNVTAVPALRICTARGRLLASRDGYLPAEDLLAWLKQHYEIAVAAPHEVLLESGKPDAVAVVRLVRQLGERNPVIREVAIRRLMPHPALARPAVVQVFSKGNLATRLAALELLGQWRAPVEGIDPWRPETVTDQRIAGLEKWLDEAAGEQAAEPEKLSPQQLAAARRQIDRMLKTDDAEADAIRQRLARLGPALLPEVYVRLKRAATDRDHERLLTLRYRLVAGESLVLRWPGGLPRLAATDTRQRQQAAEELAKLATADDQPLLLELFSDPNPLVREISLRGLQHIGGKQANVALVKLLADPEPNVRAAVLKQLEENPQASMVPKVAEYLKGEKDPDLIVHAIRFLRATGGPVALKSLMALLGHESWQVRAEAAAGIGKLDMPFRPSLTVLRLFGGADEATRLRAEAYVALIDLLDDPDAFVVSRAVEGLSSAEMAVAVEPLVKAATKHPDLASKIIEILANGENMRAKALPHFRKFCKHQNPAIRAAAVRGLCQAAPDAMEKELAAALQDTDSTVRVAAASSLFGLLEQQLQNAAAAVEEGRGMAPGTMVFQEELTALGPRDTLPTAQIIGSIKSATAEAARFFFGDSGKEKSAQATAEDAEKPTENDHPRGNDVEDKPGENNNHPDPAANGDKPTDPADKPDSPPTHYWDRWLEAYYAGRGRPQWAAAVVRPLEKMLRAEVAEERMVAAQTLVPLGKAALATPVLLDAARSHPELFHNATQILPWLVWDERARLFEQLRNLADSKDKLGYLVHAMIQIPDRRAAMRFWELLADEKLGAETAGALYTGLLRAYFGSRYYAPSRTKPSARRDLARAARPRTAAGSELQRLAALVLLAAAAPNEAAEVAGKLVADAQLSDALRRDAFQVLLLTQHRKMAIRTAITALAADGPRRKPALTYLADGPEQLSNPRGIYRLYLDSGALDTFGAVVPSGTPIIPEPPEGLETRHVRPLVDDPDPQVAAYASYLLALLGESDGLDRLIRYRRSRERDDRRSDRLVYRAIAVLDDSTHIGVLKEIYRGLDEYQVSEFYWTIRIMSGPEILRFRKQIRDEVGMSRLQ